MHSSDIDHTRPYSAGGGAYSSAALGQTTTNIYFPKTDGVTFEQANTSQIIGEPFSYGFGVLHKAMPVRILIGSG